MQEQDDVTVPLQERTVEHFSKDGKLCLVQNTTILPHHYMYYVYVLRNPLGILYKGQTNDLQKRVSQHNEDDNFHSFTKHRGPWTLVYFEKYKTRAAAKERERFLKSGKGREFLSKVVESLAPDFKSA